jgi:hypothetical protein
MRTIVRLLSALALVAAIVPATASAKKPAPKASVAKWAKKNHLKGSWKTKDADRDGLKNINEYKAGTNPRKADTDRDGLKDGDEIKVGDDPAADDASSDDSDVDTCADAGVKKGTLLRSAELEDGVFVALEIV